MLVRLNHSTKKLAVIGDPVGHSLSPLIQNTMISALGLDYIYFAQQVSRENLPAFLEAAKLLGFSGFNATMPHKEDLIPLMDTLSEEAAFYGSVNTVCIKDGKCIGYNTDGRGLIRSLEDGGFDPKGKDVVLLGAGGAAKAVSLSFVRSGARRVVVCNRNLARAEALCRKNPDVLVSVGFDGESLKKAAAECDLLVNCTSLGMTGTAAQFSDFDFLDDLPQNAMVFDLIYSPRETVLLQKARRKGHTVQNGLGMLIYQAVFALEHFTETKIDAGKMGALLRDILK
ncbi:MAG: shikimate dehydrogenase [Oscillospiraceae bacterium]|nr:shikimate dehydrogenase [Oscillospiraceae bacterium]